LNATVLQQAFSADRHLVVAVSLPVALSQFIKELREMRGQSRFGAKELLEPLAYGIANRTAGAPVHLFAVIGETAIHSRVPLVRSY
jgi:hypothetical protein